MGDVAQLVRAELAAFQNSLKDLGDHTAQAALDWRDAQYHALAEAVKGVVALSREVLDGGDRCCAAWSRFEQIDDEEY